ncbi:MAG TPA: sigma-54 dependent transcriptional regulator [Vicinamibacterales bacterium]|nr:sigma-54 dependent transcriptional regulator [Vicinamibacterales bacterium]
MATTTLVGASPAMKALQEEICYAARCDAKVLITGESGAGKEIVTRLIHEASARSRAPLITVNCAALTETLLETELFGHVRGSFTGAYRDRLGAFEMANRGTVFMDEVGETSPRMQGLLLRFMETGEIQRVGSDQVQTRVDVRVIAATNRSLIDGVAAKTFREDLYYRLNVIQLVVPPLRERREDIPLLLTHFLDMFARQYRKETPVLSPAAVTALVENPWRGNVRELKNVVERLVVRSTGEEIRPEDLPLDVARTVPRSAAPSDKAPSRPIADVLFDQIVKDKQSFWTVAYVPFMSRDLTREDLRGIVKKGLERTSGNYKVLVELLNMPPGDYKRFLGFLRKFHCHMPFQQFRTAASSQPAPADQGSFTDTAARRSVVREAGSPNSEDDQQAPAASRS